MKLSRELERLVTIRLIQEDTEAIYSLIKSERDSIFSMEIIPYYALFIQSCQEYMGYGYLPESAVLQITDIRNHIKAYADRYGKSQKKVWTADQKQNEYFQSQLRFNFMNSWNIHLNLGTYWTETHHIVGNTQQLANFLNVGNPFDDNAGKKQYELGYQIGSFVTSIRSGFAESLDTPSANRTEDRVLICKYYDLNTNRNNPIFIDKDAKELNLFCLHLLCNMNFVRYIIRPLFTDNSTWLFRVEYVVTYYTFRALQRLKGHYDNNAEMFISTSEINDILNEGDILFQSKLRNCMMHYNLEDAGVLCQEYVEQPLYGIVETCFDGIDFFSYLHKLRDLSNKIIEYLESRFDFSNIELHDL